MAKSYRTSAFLYRKAAERGDPWTAYCLALSTFEGDGVPSDLLAALRRMRLAARRGVREAKQLLH